MTKSKVDVGNPRDISRLEALLKVPNEQHLAEESRESFGRDLSRSQNAVEAQTSDTSTIKGACFRNLMREILPRNTSPMGKAARIN